MTHTTDPRDPRLGHGSDDAPVPQNEAYLVLAEAIRRRGFVRPHGGLPVHTLFVEPKRAAPTCTEPRP